MPFTDRHDAGRQLAPLAEAYRGPDTLVLGLARGGLPVAEEVAAALDAPLDVMVARKLGAPHNPEFGVGAVAPGVTYVDERTLRVLGINQDELEATAAAEHAEMRRRLRAYRGEDAPPDVRGKTVLLVDDGLATGGTARAAARSLRQGGPRKLVLLVPVGAPDSIEAITQEFDDVRVLETPEDFRAVGLWYDDFRPTTDKEVIAILKRYASTRAPHHVRVQVEGGVLDGDLTVPSGARGLVIFAHGSGSSRFSPRNRHVAQMLQREGLATMLLDLLTPEEERVDERTRHIRFDIELLAERLEAASAWAAQDERTRGLDVGYFGSSTGGGAALVAASREPHRIRAVVSRGGRPDLAGDALPGVQAPTLLIVGSRDEVVIALNQAAFGKLRHEKRLDIVPGATHLFSEPGALDEVARDAARWFVDHFGAAPRRETPPAGRA